MIQKIFWVAVLLSCSYTVGVFYAPEQTDTIAAKIGIEKYNEFVRSFKTTLDDVTTDIPSKDEFLEWGKAALSWALDLKDTVTGGIGTTKETLDSVRSTLSWAEATYNDAKDTFNQAKDFIEWASDKIEQVSQTLNDVEKLGDSITNMVNTDRVDAAIQ